MKPGEFAAKVKQEAASLKQVAAKANVKVE
jgi:hypothetical protein